MSVVKLLSRVVSSDDLAFGITSDPLAQFAVVLSALIHDLDHPGVPNTTLVNEGTDLAARYKNKSVAEQNSVDLFWNLLMEGSDFAELRSCIYANQAEFYRFRSVIVNGAYTSIM